MTPMQALAAATITAAEAMGLEGTIGSIQPDKQADLLIVGADPTRDITALIDVRVVVQSGRIIHQRRK